MIKKNLDSNENKKDKLLKLTVRILRQEAKKLSVPLYSRKNKALLVDLILKYQKKALIEDQINICIGQLNLLVIIDIFKRSLFN